MLRVAYLTLYNLFGIAGWGFILFTVVTMASEGRLKRLWDEHEWTVKVVQGAAVLEIAHAALGLVRSPMSRTLIQVFSRVAIVWGAQDPLYKYPFTPFPKPKGCELTLESGPECTEERNQQVIAVTLITWSIAELIRFSFYLFNTVDPKIVPFPIIWLRYTGFIVLYPIGVAGEMISAYLTLPLIMKGMCPSFEGLVKECPSNAETLLYVFLFQYLWGLPMLYMTMLGERKKRLYPKPPPKLQGVVFPLTKKGDRSTTPTAKEIFGAALEPVDKVAAEKVRKEKNWRFGYNKHIVNNLLVSAKSEQAALKIAQAGIDAMYKTFDFIAADGSTLKFEEALKKGVNRFHTHTIVGKKGKPAAGALKVTVPYKNYENGKMVTLEGLELMKQIDVWVDYGTIEPDCGEAIKEVVRNPGWCDLSGQYFVLLGATSAMGPFNLLKQLGAHIIAVDLDRPQIWKKIIESIEDSHATVSFAMKEPFTGQTGEDLYKVCGANIMNDTPDICMWLKDALPKLCKAKPVTVGGYAYLDGELHVRVNLACDAIMQSVITNYGAKNTRLANLCTPTDAYLISKIANEGSATFYKNAPLWMKMLQPLAQMGGKLLPNAKKPLKADDGTEFYYMDGLVVAQGPNYGWAKRLQQWRAILARQAGCTVSINIAPATATLSVVHNKAFAAAYGGMRAFKPMEIFYQEVSLSVMGALLIFDITSPKSMANPNNKLSNPMALMGHNAFHGGAMRCLYMYTTVGEMAVLIFYFKTYGLMLLAAAAGGVALAFNMSK